jgi:hypothetical protein
VRATEKNLEHSAAVDQMKARRDLAKLYRKATMSDEDALFNLPLWMRSGVLAKVLVMHDLYRRFLSVPGVLVEFGTWLGMNLVLLENLRALLEPFNKDQRRIIGFDTFAGYREGKFAKAGLYNSGRGHIAYLDKLLKAHAACNVYGHQPFSHELVEGDVTHTAPAYFAAHPQILVAFAYFDMGPYAPTRAALKAIKPHLVGGSILLMDELTLSTEPGEARAFKEVFKPSEYRLEKCALYPSKTIVEIMR